MRIRYENVSAGSNSGPNHFSNKLKKYLERLDCHFTLTNQDVSLCFTQATMPKTSTLVQRMDGIWFNPAQDYKSMNTPFKQTYEAADGVIYQSFFDQKLIEYQFGKHHNTTIINNGADLELISQLQPYDHKILETAENVWCTASHFAGRHHKRLYENIRYFLEHSGNKDVLLIAGTIDFDNFKHPRIYYLGNLDISTLLSVFKRSKYFIHLARLDHCPNVVVDARGAGCQIICSNLGGTHEIAGEDAVVIEEEEWDYSPFDYNQPSKLDFTKKIKNTFNRDIDMTTVSKKYFNFLKETRNA